LGYPIKNSAKYSLKLKTGSEWGELPPAGGTGGPDNVCVMRTLPGKRRVNSGRRERNRSSTSGGSSYTLTCWLSEGEFATTAQEILQKNTRIHNRICKHMIERI
jgi:hypothetical protein